MMWSQCRWDMNTWNVFGRAGPCRASTEIPKSRTPLPRSHSTYSPAARVELHAGGVAAEGAAHGEVELALDEALRLLRRVQLPPGGRHERRHELALEAGAVGATGMEPRVPQKRTSIRPGPRRRRPRGRRARGRPARPGRTERRRRAG